MLKQCPLTDLLRRPEESSLIACLKSALDGEKYPLTLQDRE